MGKVYAILEKALREKIGINIHQGKTKLWNKAGNKSSMTDALTRAARVVKPDAVVWRRDWALPPSQQGLEVFRSSQAHMAAKFKEQALLYERIRLIEDWQVGLLRLFENSARCSLGQLGRLPRNGETLTPTSRRKHHQRNEHGTCFHGCC